MSFDVTISDDFTELTVSGVTIGSMRQGRFTAKRKDEEKCQTELSDSDNVHVYFLSSCPLLMVLGRKDNHYVLIHKWDFPELEAVSRAEIESTIRTFPGERFNIR